MSRLRGAWPWARLACARVRSEGVRSTTHRNRPPRGGGQWAILWLRLLECKKGCSKFQIYVGVRPFGLSHPKKQNPEPAVRSTAVSRVK